MADISADEQMSWENYIDWLSRPNCIGCGTISEEFYHVNPPGGFGREEMRICVKCLHKGEFEDCYERLLTRGNLEKRDVKDGDMPKHGTLRGEL